MLLYIIILIVGFVVLIKCADLFVDGASGIAENFHVSKMLIGLTIVSFGTSAPEFAVSVKSLLANSGDIVLGNVIGSNILNIFLILGLSAIVHPLVVKNNTVKKELPITILITVLFAVLLSDSIFDPGFSNSFTRGDGVALILFFTIFVYYLVAMSRNKIVDEDVKEEKKAKEEEKKKLSLPRSIIYTIIGLVGIILGSNYVVESACDIAFYLGISERLISLTIIALGTSLPELVTSVTATIKGEYDIAIGNVVGSNIFNIGIVIGLPIAILGGIYKINFSYIDIIVMILAAFLLYVFAHRKYKISRLDGVIFLLIFVAYYSYVIFA